MNEINELLVVGLCCCCCYLVKFWVLFPGLNSLAVNWLTDRSFLLSKTHSLWIKVCCYLIASSVMEKFRCLKFDSIGFETLVTSKRFLLLLNKQNLILNEHLHRLTSTPLLWLELNNWSALDSLDSHYSSLLTQMQSDFESLERVFFFPLNLTFQLKQFESSVNYIPNYLRKSYDKNVF